MKRPAYRALALAIILGGPASLGLARASALVINANASDPAPRAAWEAAVQQFRAENPGIAVTLNIYDHESYKRAIRNWLTAAPPDVVFWFAGHRMRQFVGPKLLADVSDLYPAPVKRALHKSALDAVSVKERQYGVPYTYYQVGFYFRRDLLQAARIEPPRTWNELLAACARLRARGIEPFAIGSRDLWPTAAWFDYLNLRLNGARFHLELMAGRVPYTDGRVREVFAYWRSLVEGQCFSRNHASSSWQEAQALLYRGQAGMMLIGNYIVPNFPGEVRASMEFVRFPVIRPEVPQAEEAPINSLHIPAKARNRQEARRFLAFVLRPEVQERLNRALYQIPVHRAAQTGDDRFLQAGQTLLAEAETLTQYFDRDTNEELAMIAMRGFQEFMVHPERLEAILGTIEQARRRIYKH